jgi:DNA-binding MarR family transcriptional regulator
VPSSTIEPAAKATREADIASDEAAHALEARDAGTPAPPAPLELSAPRLRTAVARMARWLRPTAAAGPLTATEIDMLVVAEKHGPARMSDLASFCGLNPTMLSRMVPRLEQSGFLRRQADPSDGRVWRVEATKKADALLQRVRSERNDALSQLLTELDEPEQHAIAAAIPVLEKLSERLRSQTAADGSRR